MIPAMASPGQESESLNVQFLVDSMLARVHTLGLTATSITSTNVGSNRASLWTTCPGGSGGLSFIAKTWRDCGQVASLRRDRRKFGIRNWRPRRGWGKLRDAPPQV